MEEPANCPLMMGPFKATNTRCLGKTCAWWMPNDGCCAIASLAASAAVASEALNTEIQVVNYEGT